jgi:hypothetical protein
MYKKPSYHPKEQRETYKISKQKKVEMIKTWQEKLDKTLKLNLNKLSASNYDSISKTVLDLFGQALLDDDIVQFANVFHSLSCAQKNNQSLYVNIIKDIEQFAENKEHKQLLLVTV